MLQCFYIAEWSRGQLSGLISRRSQVRILPPLFKMFSNSKKQGDAGLGIAIQYFTSLGLTVLIPLTDSQPYDLVFERNKQLYKVQVRTTTKQYKSGVYWVDLRSLGGNRSFHKIKKFNPTEYDYLFAISGDNKTLLVPTSVISNKSAISFKKHDEYIVECKQFKKSE